MDVDAHVAALDREGRMLVDAARRAGPEAPVPPCPGWRVADLLAHIGFVHRWATRYVRTAITEMVDEASEAAILERAPPEDERCDWVAEGHGALVAALRAAPTDLDCWTFLAAPSPLAMWARRQAHETAVHRVDAELSAGPAPTPVEPELAADGIDELLFGFFGRPARSPAEGDPVPGGAVTIGLEVLDGPGRHGVDGSGGWTLQVSEGKVCARRGTGTGGDEPAVRVRGTASDLYLLLWHRRLLEGLDVDGSADRFVRAWGSQSVTWA